VRDPRKPARGCGPRNYERPDERIREDANEALTYDELVDATFVEVVVFRGVVTLCGRVDTHAAKRAAEDCVLRVRGVRDVMNELELS
jgi:osmotically-inducible protein OsmY